MKKNLLASALMILGLGAMAQTQRTCLFEEFTGETCPPCASTNPGLNAILLSATNAPKIIAIKWQVPIPSTPANSWSLYKTNQAEIDWRYRSPASGGYGYASQNNASSAVTSQGVNSAPSGRIDGQHQWVFGATSDHPTYISNAVISTAHSYTTPFSINMIREWNATGSAINLTVNITATSPFTAATGTAPLVLRTVMVERLIQFSVQPGTNGEKTFEDVAIKSFPNPGFQGGTALPSSWTTGQTQTFTMTCALPSYTRKKTEVAIVCFIQDDNDEKIWQAARADKEALTYDAKAVSAKVEATCDASVSPVITVQNNGVAAITNMTIVPAIDNVAAPQYVWTGNLASGANTSINLSAITTGTANGSHTFSYNITAINNADFDITNNTGKISYQVASSFQGTPVDEPFALAPFPPANWTQANGDNGPAWTRTLSAGSYNLLPLQSAKYGFYTNTVIGDIDELYLPPMDLSGGNAPILSFDVAYATRVGTNDKLEVFVSKDCGAHWNSVWMAAGPNLASTDPNTSLPREVNVGEYIPDANEDGTYHWRTETVNLTGYNVSNVLAKFVTTNDHGNSLYLDMVNLYQMDKVGLSKVGSNDVSVIVFPNPSNGNTTVRITAKHAGSANISVMNTLGQVVYQNQVALNGGNNNVQVDASRFAAGVYNVVIDTDNGSLVKKLTVTK